MKRRDFITGAAGSAAAWPLAARAQQTDKPPVIGYLGSAELVEKPWLAAYVQRLSDLGWVEGHTVTTIYRWADGRTDRAAEIATEFVRLKVDLIVAGGTAVATVKRATSDIPIVFRGANDPIGGGLVQSLARPGGNATGLSNQATDLSGKRLELLREVVPGLRRLAIMTDIGFPQAVLERDAVLGAAHTLPLDVARMDVRRYEDLAPAFAALGAKPDALYVVGNALLNSYRSEIAALALNARLATIFNNSSWPATGGLMSYGPDFTDLWRRSADYVDKILRGTRPADIPVEQPTKFELVVNMKTAKTLGLVVPPTLLARADEVIE